MGRYSGIIQSWWFSEGKSGTVNDKEKEVVVVVAEVGDMAGNAGKGSPGNECG